MAGKTKGLLVKGVAKAAEMLLIPFHEKMLASNEQRRLRAEARWFVCAAQADAHPTEANKAQAARAARRYERVIEDRQEYMDAHAEFCALIDEVNR